MSNIVIQELKALIAKFDDEPVVETAETDAKEIGSETLAYIKANALTDLIAIAKSALLGMATGTPYATILSTVATEGEAAGIAIAKGSEAVVVAAAQADLLATGQINAVSTGAPVPSPVDPAAAGAAAAGVDAAVAPAPAAAS